MGTMSRVACECLQASCKLSRAPELMGFPRRSIHRSSPFLRKTAANQLALLSQSLLSWRLKVSIEAPSCSNTSAKDLAPTAATQLPFRDRYFTPLPGPEGRVAMYLAKCVVPLQWIWLSSSDNALRLWTALRARPCDSNRKPSSVIQQLSR
jgi:hypothetical protein